MQNAARFRGYTLLETMLASGIAVIIIVVASLFFLDITKSKEQYLIRQDLNYAFQFSTDIIGRSIKNAKSLDRNASDLDVHPGTLGLAMPDPSQSPTIIRSTGTDLTMSKGAAAPQSMLLQRIRVRQFLVSANTDNNTPAMLTITLGMESSVDPEIQKTETFSFSIRTPLL